MKLKFLQNILVYCILNLVALHSAAFAQDEDTNERYGKGKFLISDNYVHEWLVFPSIDGESIFGDRLINLKPRYGRSVAVIFISSWCIPCQNLMPEFKELYEKHRSLFSDVVFVFANDTAKDAQGFVKEYGLDAPAILANDELMAKFNHPESPTIYIGDRRGWMTKRLKSSTREDIVKADEFLSQLARG